LLLADMQSSKHRETKQINTGTIHVTLMTARIFLFCTPVQLLEAQT